MHKYKYTYTFNVAINNFDTWQSNNNKYYFSTLQKIRIFRNHLNHCNEYHASTATHENTVFLKQNITTFGNFLTTSVRP